MTTATALQPAGAPSMLGLDVVSHQTTGLEMVSMSTSADDDVPMVRHLWTADPSAHIFDEKLWLYTSHDRNDGTGEGPDRFNMRDYRAFSFESTKEAPRDQGVILSLENVPWASKQLWAPDVVRDRHGLYHLFFPAKDEGGRFRIGHAQATEPYGPFVADETPIEGSSSIDPAAFIDDDGQAFLYFGGLWGGQLEFLRGEMDAEHAPIDPTRCAMAPLMAPLSADPRAHECRPPRLTTPPPSARPVLPGAQAAPTHPGAQPQQLGSLPWPQELASGRLEFGGVSMLIHRRRTCARFWCRRASS